MSSNPPAYTASASDTPVPEVIQQAACACTCPLHSPATALQTAGQATLPWSHPSAVILPPHTYALPFAPPVYSLTLKTMDWDALAKVRTRESSVTIIVRHLLHKGNRLSVALRAHFVALSGVQRLVMSPSGYRVVQRYEQKDEKHTLDSGILEFVAEERPDEGKIWWRGKEAGLGYFEERVGWSKKGDVQEDGKGLREVRIVVEA